MREVAKRSFDGGRENQFPVLSPSFAIAQQPPRQRGPWVGIILTPKSLLTILPPDMASSSKICLMQQHKNGRRIFAPTTIVLQYVFRLFYYLENSIQNDLEMLFVLNKP